MGVVFKPHPLLGEDFHPGQAGRQDPTEYASCDAGLNETRKHHSNHARARAFKSPGADILKYLASNQPGRVARTASQGQLPGYRGRHAAALARFVRITLAI